MKNVLYSKTIVQARDSEDGDTATVLYLCEEVNALVIWVNGYDGMEFVKKFYAFEKDKAIEEAVKLGEKRIEAWKQYHTEAI